MKKLSNITNFGKNSTKRYNSLRPINENKKLILENESIEKSDVVKFFSKLFESREMAHVYHLQVRGDVGSHAKHLALGEFYEGIVDPLDNLIELYQGQYNEIIDGYDVIDTNATKTLDPIKYFEQLGDFVKEERKCFDEEDTHYFNIIDDILVLIYKTLYKLRFNK